MSWLTTFQRKSAHYKSYSQATIVPLTALQPQAREFDGGVYDSNGNLCENALHVKNGYKNRMPAKLAGEIAESKLTGKYIFGGMLQINILATF